MMNLVAWNIRGFNDPIKIKEVKDFLLKQNAGCSAMFETRVRRQKMDSLQKKLRIQWSWSSNYDHSPRGRIWVGWKPGEMNVTCLDVIEQCIAFQITMSNKVFMVVDVYGLHTIRDRKDLWKDLLQIRNIRTGPMIILGDFNAIHSATDKTNGVEVSEAETQDFTQFLLDANLIEAPSSGLYYSWNNKGEGNNRICSRIDKAFINHEMLLLYHDLMVNYQPEGISDHTPLVIRFCQHEMTKGRPFKSLNFMAFDERFILIIQEAWQSSRRGSKLQMI